MRKLLIPAFAICAAAATIVGCDTQTPNSNSQHVAMKDDARVALEKMEAADSSGGLRNAVQNAYGYVVFPEIGKAAVGIGGASGKGVVYRNGQQVGTVTLDQGSIGLQAGGATYSELILLDQAQFNDLQQSNFKLGAQAEAQLVKLGAAGATQFNKESRVFVLPQGGLILGVSVNGQKFNYHGDQGSM